MLRVIIIDDDLLSRKILERLCLGHPQLELKGIFDNARSALQMLEQTPESCDLIFLDVEMPGMSGMEFLEQAPVLFMVIFTTTKPEYAFDAFEYNAVDFLKKPIQKGRFDQAVEKAVEFNQKRRENHSAARAHSNDIFIREDGVYLRISYDDILYFENVGDYIKVKTQQKQHIIYGALKTVDEKLNDPRFLKVHRSFIVNLDKIKSIDDHSLVIEKTVIPISRAHKAELMSRINIL